MKKDPAFQAWRKKIIAQYKMNPLLKKRLDLFKLGGDKFFSLEGDLVNILQEYNKDNGLGLSDKDITTLSFSGQQDSKDFKSI
ncbi:hypothetical protein [Pedobacter sp. MC2016-24]|uniref:hypothetical protein n=1 Tax=Pedobacter sp. MC2016-24 TaxID=2780090 RepID=UPI0018805DED|nr:hypothetical protein [Pedobacter sp. MC2016-24]MBE9599484.1 hypothetical protein [Pedobacter sp. MC2016-24]